MVQYFDWLPQVEALKNVDSIENELIIFQYSQVMPELLMDMPFHAETMRNPHKFDFFMFVKHFAGSATLKIDMEEYVLSGPINTIKLAPGQIVSIEQKSDDFDAIVMLMSKRFVENLMVYMRDYTYKVWKECICNRALQPGGGLLLKYIFQCYTPHTSG